MDRQECSLRLIEAEDLPLLHQWRNSERIRQASFTDHLIKYEDHIAWYEGLTKDLNRECLLFEIIHIPIGVVNIRKDPKNNIGYWGFYVGNESAPRGSGFAMGVLALKYIFEVRLIRKLCSEVLAKNLPSIKYHAKLGFVQEAIFRRHVVKNGEPVDVISYAIFDDTWRTIRERLFRSCFGGTDSE